MRRGRFLAQGHDHELGIGQARFCVVSRRGSQRDRTAAACLAAR
jgi:hypothetical protein